RPTKRKGRSLREPLSAHMRNPRQRRHVVRAVVAAVGGEALLDGGACGLPLVVVERADRLGERTGESDDCLPELVGVCVTERERNLSQLRLAEPGCPDEPADPV